jgi:mycothiol synthase
MITYAWCERLGADDRAQAAALVEQAGRYDSDAGFSAIEIGEVESGPSGDETVWHLPITARKDLGAGPDTSSVMVAYLRLSVDARGHGTIKYTVHPGYRSRGVSTQLVEELGLDVSVPGGWCGTGAASLRCWAYGAHPASERLTRRFGIEPVARQWTLIRHLTGPFALELTVRAIPDGVEIEGPFDLDDEQAAAGVGDVLMRAALAKTQFDQLNTDLAERRGRVLIATADARPAGFVWFDPHTHAHTELRAAWIHALITAEDLRGSGFGGALLTRALLELKAAGAQLTLLPIDPDDQAALRLSRLASFEQEDAHACYQIGEWSDPPAVVRFRG